MLLLPNQENPLQVQFQAPYRVLKRMSLTNYIIATPDRCSQQRLCHVVMLKDFVQPPTEDPHPTPVCLTEPCNLVEETTEVGDMREKPAVKLASLRHSIT